MHPATSPRTVLRPAALLVWMRWAVSSASFLEAACLSTNFSTAIFFTVGVLCLEVLNLVTLCRCFLGTIA